MTFFTDTTCTNQTSFVFGTTATPQADGQWHSITKSITAPSDAVSGLVRLIVLGGEVFFDDVSFQGLPTAVRLHSFERRARHAARTRGATLP